jgi:hypothetical protein
MRRVCALLGLLALMGVACGKYGPPVRSRPAPQAEATAEADAESVEADDEERERPQ